ncbi:MAG: DUF4093 domain-containing protein [Oscillospiraceae bacterium]|nr:DUF4093 domain-containing protein [Oscillospiraceae bacterium]
MSKPKIAEVIVVEGRYDKQAVLCAVDALVIETGGFAIFNDEQKRRELKALAEERGLIILTDSDSAGQVIRGHLKGLAKNVKVAFIPDIAGKERRKAIRSKEGKLGVEGMPPDVILAVLERAGAFVGATVPTLITTADLYDLGLNGHPNAKARRQGLQRVLRLPQRMSSRDLCRVLSGRYTVDEIRTILSQNNG